MFKQTLAYLALFLVSLVIFLIAFLPASFAWQHVIGPRTHLQSIGLQVKAVEGTIWQGRAQVLFRFVEGVAEWNLSVSELTQLRLPLALKLDTNAGNMESEVALSLAGVSVDIPKMDIEIASLNKFLELHRLRASGELLVRNLKLRIEDKMVQTASGKINWTGGDVRYPAGREMHERNIPPVYGTLSSASVGNLSLGLRDQEASFDFLSASIDESGVAFVEVRRRLLDIADEPWSASSEETDVVFKVKKPLLQDF